MYFVAYVLAMMAAFDASSFSARNVSTLDSLPIVTRIDDAKPSSSRTAARTWSLWMKSTSFCSARSSRPDSLLPSVFRLGVPCTSTRAFASYTWVWRNDTPSEARTTANVARMTVPLRRRST